MGLFDKKKDDFGSPVERIDLGPAPSKKEALSGRNQATSGNASIPPSTFAAPLPSTPVVMKAPTEEDFLAEEAPPLRYGINQAIELMRSLPGDNVELVVQVVKRTLESTHIQISAIIQDATRKQGEIEGRVGLLKQEIAELEREIATRRAEITRMDADLRETTLVKDRLILAEKLGNAPAQTTPVTAPAPIAAASVPAPPVNLDRPGPSPSPRTSGAHPAVSPASTDGHPAGRTAANPVVRGEDSYPGRAGSNPIARGEDSHPPGRTGAHPIARGDDAHLPTRTGAQPIVSRPLPGSNPPRK